MEGGERRGSGLPMTLALIHTTSVLIPLFSTLCRQHLPGTDFYHVVDESLIKNTIRSGSLSAATVRRLAGYVQSAQEAGADAVLVTCSSIGPAVAAARPLVDIPVFRIDEAMAARAVSEGSIIGVLATLRTTLEPTVELIRQTAAAAGKPVEVVTGLCEGAFEAVSAGDTATHDRLVSEGLAGLLEKADAVVLAQASMARVVEQLPAERLTRPVLSSPELAILQLGAAIDGMRRRG